MILFVQANLGLYFDVVVEEAAVVVAAAVEHRRPPLRYTLFQEFQAF